MSKKSQVELMQKALCEEMMETCKEAKRQLAKKMTQHGSGLTMSRNRVAPYSVSKIPTASLQRARTSRAQDNKARMESIVGFLARQLDNNLNDSDLKEITRQLSSLISIMKLHNVHQNVLDSMTETRNTFRDLSRSPMGVSFHSPTLKQKITQLLMMSIIMIHSILDDGKTFTQVQSQI